MSNDDTSPNSYCWFANDKPYYRSVLIGPGIATRLVISHGRALISTDNHEVRIISVRAGELLKTLEGHEGGVWDMCTYGRNTLVTGSTDRTVRIWNLSTGVCTHVLRGHEATVRCLGIARPEVSDDGKEKQPGRPLIVSGSRDGTLRVWTLPKPGEESNRLEGTGPEESIGSSNESPYLRLLLSGHTSAIRALDVKGRTVVTGSYDTTVRVWDIVTGECKFVFSGHTQKVYAVVLDLDNQCVFSGSMDTTIRQWSLESGECLNVLDGHTSLVALLSLSPQYLVSGSADGTARVWDRSTGVSIHELSGASAQAGAITTVYHDDKKVISGCQGVLQL